MVTTRRAARLRPSPQQSAATAPTTADFPSVPATPLPAVLDRTESTLTSPTTHSRPLQDASSSSRWSKPVMPAPESRQPRTPRDHQPIVPSHEEMHPARHQISTTRPLDEARWLGFQAMGAQTEPIKRNNSKRAAAQQTPTRTGELPRDARVTTPEFKFSFQRQSVELSPEARKMMADSREEASRIRAQMMAATQAAEAGGQVGSPSGRRIATPKGRANRFSDVHMAEFRKMDSIANHPSVHRVNQTPLKRAAPTASLKRSPSKAELDGPTAQSSLMAPTATSLKRKQSKASITSISIAEKLKNAGPVKTLRAFNAAQPMGVPAKRAKHGKGEDVSASNSPARSEAYPSEQLALTTATPRDERRTRAKSRASLPHAHGLPSSLTSPTKASLARAQSARNLKANGNVSTPIVPGSQAPALRTAMAAAGMVTRNGSGNLKPSVKSILRTPQRLYSHDPLKVAAGTHFTPPVISSTRIMNRLPALPGTGAMIKRVIFSGSAKSRDASTEMPQALNYPVLPVPVEYPALERPLSMVVPPLQPSPSPRRAPPSGEFTFRSGQPFSFNPLTSNPPSAKGATIRAVVADDERFDRRANRRVATPYVNKRKAELLDDMIEKENLEDYHHPVDQDDKPSFVEERPAKKIKGHPPPPKMEVRKEKPLGRFARAKKALSLARLNLLAAPKKRA